MKIITNDEIKNICLMLLHNFDQFCSENNLSYFLGYGTALGAIRHKGFIPWDDDIDVIMPRSDYEKLIKIYNSQEYLLLCNENDSSYFYPFAKLCDKNTILIEEHFENDKNMGVYIDIFPLDGNGNNMEMAIKHLHKCIKMQHKLNNAMAKHFFKSNRSFILEVIRYIRFRCIKFVGAKHYYDCLNRIVKKYRYEESTYISNNSWCTYAEKDLFDKSIFEDKMMVDFEGSQYPMVKKYDNYLKSLYGDYMKLPPEDERISHHDMKVYYKNTKEVTVYGNNNK